MSKRELKRFIKSMNRRIKYHQSDHPDPYKVSNAVIVALVEVVNAVNEATSK